MGLGLAGTLLVVAAPGCAQASPSAATSFDADAAWRSFETLPREHYGYFRRPGIDGEAILAAFAARAKAARSDKEFIDTLQLISRNYADPHFIVGPFDADDWAIIPTSSDLFGAVDGRNFRIVETRFAGDAAANQVAIGSEVIRLAAAGY